MCVCVYFPQFCDINNLVEKMVKFTLVKKNSKIFLNFLSPKKKKKPQKIVSQKNHWINYFGYITKLKKNILVKFNARN